MTDAALGDSSVETTPAGTGTAAATPAGDRPSAGPPPSDPPSANPAEQPATWAPAPVPPAAEVLVAAGLPSWMAELLARRGVTDEAAARRFLNPSLDQLHDPHRLYGMRDAVARLVAARERGERVAVVGDYDVDGVTATALLVAVLGACGIAAEAILPHRLREGYGFQPVHAERAAEAGCKLIVTVDCGVTSGEAVEAARRAGLDVVVTDHHLPGEELPQGTLLVNPRQELCDYPFSGLAGVGLALKLALAVAAACRRRLDPTTLLRVACLGTIADLVPLVDENRAIAALGLRALGETSSLGLRALFRCAGVEPPVRAADVAFRLGPRLNAAGRLDDARGALELLLSRDRERCDALAAQLDGLNRERQGEERRVVEEARRRILERCATGLPPVLVEWDGGWHQGVLGIAAGRLARDFHRPTLLLAVGEDSATGSGRSVPGIALHDFLARWRADLARFGGHDQAVGLTVELSPGDQPTAPLEHLRTAWEEAAGEWPADLLAPRYEYELELPPTRVTRRLFAQLARLEPYGQGNPEPLVRVGPLTLAGTPRIFGKETKHLSALASGADGGEVGLLGWRWGERAERLEGTFEVLAFVERDTFRQSPRFGEPVLRLVDARPA